MWQMIHSFQSSVKQIFNLVLRELHNLLQILYVVILLYQGLPLALEGLLLLLLLQVSLNELLLVRRKRKQQKEDQQKEERLLLVREEKQEERELKLRLKQIDYETLRKLVAYENLVKEEKLYVVRDLVQGKLDIAEKVLKENLKSSASGTSGQES